MYLLGIYVLQITSNDSSNAVSFLHGSQTALNSIVTEDGQLLLTGNGSTLGKIISACLLAC